MQNRNIDSPTGANSNKIEDEDIIKFAEEVLGDPDDDIIELDDDETLKLENDDIIDLTEIADKQIQSDDDILDLTEDIEITPESENEFLELEDVTQESKDDDETHFGLVDDDDLTLLDNAVLDLDDVVEEITAAEKNITTQEDTVADEHLSQSTEFMRATENIELTEADRNALESEFGYEAPAEGLTDPDALDTLASGDIEEEILLDFNDDVTENTIDEVDLEAELLEDQPAEAPAVDGPHDKMELTETDRRILEEELGRDIEVKTASALADEDTADDTRSLSETNDDDSDQLGAPDQPGRIENTVPPALEEEFSDAKDKSEIETDVDDDAKMAFDQDLAAPTSDRTESADGSLAMEEDYDQMSAATDIETDDSEPDTDVVMNDNDPVDEFDFDIDDTAEQLDVETDDLELAPLTAEEELSVEALLAEVESPDDTDQPGKIDSKDDQPAMDADTGEIPPNVAQSDEKQAAAQLDMNFDSVEETDEHDLHKVGDPILIRVKEPATPDHADEESLLNDVFDQKPEAEALPAAPFEVAVEKAVKKIFDEKIESILFDAIDRAVTKEIGRLKTLILGDRDQID